MTNRQALAKVFSLLSAQQRNNLLWHVRNKTRIVTGVEAKRVYTDGKGGA